MKPIPNPGSKEAIEQGCICPVSDKYHGKGFPWGGVNPAFWIREGCPLHGIQVDFTEGAK